MAPVLERLKKYGSHAAGSGIILAAAVFLAGCSAPKPPQTIIEHTGNFGGFSALNWTNPSAAPLPAAPPAQTQPQPPPPSVNWIPLNEWAAGHDLAPPRRKGSQIILESSRGKMRLAIGVIEAAWNGIRVSLGYPPRMVDGRVCLSDPDLDKNLEPLLCAPPLGFGTNRVIVIDPGHGGHNSGTHSVLDGRFEKEFTLDMAKRLEPLLQSNGWTVFLTRTNDSDVSLSNRVTLAVSRHAAVFLSLHFNATPDRNPDIRGIETYCVTPVGLPSTLARGYSDPVFLPFPANDFDAQNLQLAVHIQKALVRGTGLEDRGVCRARFMTVLQGQECPAVLVEIGYLSNPQEAALIENPRWRGKVAHVLASALP